MKPADPLGWDGDPDPVLDAKELEALAVAIAASDAARRGLEAWQAKRAEAWLTAALGPALETYRDVRELAGSEGGGSWVWRAVTAVLNAAMVNGAPDPLAAVALADEGKRGGYGGEVFGYACRVSREIFADKWRPATEDEARATVDTEHGPALRWDAAFADLLVGMRGDCAAEIAESVRKNAAERTAKAQSANPPPAGDLWHLWTERNLTMGRCPRWLRALADALWADKWRPALVLERRTVGLYRGGLVTILRGLDARTVEPDGRIIGALGVATGRVGALTVNADALRGMGRGPALRRALDVTLAVRFVPWFASLVQRRETESDWVHLEGADDLSVWGAMVASMGLAVNEVRVAAMKRAVKALAGQIVTLDGGIEVSLFDGYRYDPGGGRGRRARLALCPGPPWWSRAVGPWSGEYAYLAPIPVLDGWLPPLYGRDNEHAALARFWFLFLSELAEQAPRIATHGAALFPTGRAASLALEAAVRTPPPLLIEKQLSMWKEAEIIEEVETNCYNLHPRFAAERAVLVEGGNRRIGAKEDGQHGAAVRAALRKGATPPRRKSKRKPPPT